MSDYEVLPTPVPTDAVGDKIEVTEFFGYFCPHSNALDPSLQAWATRQADKIAFRRVPVAFGASPAYVSQQKLYYALEAMGLVPAVHEKVFTAIHMARQALNDKRGIIAFVEKQGVDAKKFSDLYDSFSINARASNATKMQNDYKINGVPTLAVDGRFVTSPAVVAANRKGGAEGALFTAMFQVLDGLVAKAATEKPNQKS